MGDYSLNDYVLDIIQACSLDLRWEVCCLLRWSNGASLNFKDEDRTVVSISLSTTHISSVGREVFRIEGAGWSNSCRIRDYLKSRGLIGGNNG